MSFPIDVSVKVAAHNGSFVRKLKLNSGLTVMLGPNGSGKTHLLRGLKSALGTHVSGKRVRFLSAGRMGMLERFRSDFDGQRGKVRYDEATYGTKSDAARRHLTETLSGDFQTLAVRADILIKIQERLRKLFRREVLIDWDGGNLKISFSRTDLEEDAYSSGREASGLMHLVGVLAALYDDEVGALLLDEPEVSMHPQLQAFLLREIVGVAGYPGAGTNKKIVVIATHSSEMLQIKSTKDLLSLVFCYDLASDPVQMDESIGELSSKKIQNLVARLGQEHKLSFFSKRPLLVEGASDVIICNALSLKADIYLEAAGSQLLPVIGKGQMPVVCKLLRLLGKEPLCLADADGIADGLDLVQFYADTQVASDLASDHGHAGLIQMAKSIHSDFSDLVDKQWEEISFVVESHPYLLSGSEKELRARRRAAFCSLFLTSDEDLKAVGAHGAWLKIKVRYKSLLDVLEKCGLFILRKGPIESYYLEFDIASLGKPSAAVVEAENVAKMEAEDLESCYGVILRCLRHAASVEPISESKALRDLLLSVAAPAHARFRDGDNSSSYNMLARQILGDRAKIFDLAVRNGFLVVSIASEILDVRGFPVSIGKSDDVRVCIDRALA